MKFGHKKSYGQLLAENQKLKKQLKEQYDRHACDSTEIQFNPHVNIGTYFDDGTQSHGLYLNLTGMPDGEIARKGAQYLMELVFGKDGYEH